MPDRQGIESSVVEEKSQNTQSHVYVFFHIHTDIVATIP